MQSTFRETEDCTISFQFPEDVASAFPVLLDHLYRPESDTSTVTRENFCALLYLSDFFLVNELQELVFAFIERDMYNLERMETYLDAFGSSDDEDSRRVLSIAPRVCAEMVLHIDEDSNLLKKLTPGMFLHVVIAASKDDELSPDETDHILNLSLRYMLHSNSVTVARAIIHELRLSSSIDLASKQAVNLLEAMAVLGWDEEFGGHVCKNSRLFGMLASLVHSQFYDLDFEEFIAETDKLPNSVLPLILRESLFERLEDKVKLTCICRHVNAKRERDVSFSVRRNVSISFVGAIVGIQCRLTISEYLYLEIRHGERRLDNCNSLLDHGIDSDVELNVSWMGL